LNTLSPSTVRARVRIKDTLSPPTVDIVIIAHTAVTVRVRVRVRVRVMVRVRAGVKVRAIVISHVTIIYQCSDSLHFPRTIAMKNAFL
jgi:hypothetical protein